mmetsp:Transcript_27087/g.62438  ORF Transcript_27087/g.62438 Transcript_27087/m.62438 type:complete len:243 (-) Transcript_27087:27-755(-)
MTAEQAVSLLSHLPSGVRVEAAVACFSGIVNLELYLPLLDKLLSYEQVDALTERLGIMNIWNPMRAERRYALDLAHPDEHAVTVDLVNLAVVEPEENWKGETYNGKPFQLPLSWTTVVPDSGLVTLDYVTKIKVVRYRRMLQRKCLCFDPFRFESEIQAEAASERALRLERAGLAELSRCHQRQATMQDGRNLEAERADQRQKHAKAKANQIAAGRDERRQRKDSAGSRRPSAGKRRPTIAS